MRARDEVLAIPVLVDPVRSPVVVTGGHHGVVVDRVASRVLLGSRHAIGADRGHGISSRGCQNGSRSPLVDGLGRHGQRHCSEGCQQKNGGEFRNDGHLEDNEVDVKLSETRGFVVEVAS